MGEKPIVFRGYFSKGTCQMINDTLTGREGVKMDAMRVFRQTKKGRHLLAAVFRG